MTIKVFWSADDEEWVATDSGRPGCSAWGSTANSALRELKLAQKAWDETHQKQFRSIKDVSSGVKSILSRAEMK